MALAPLGTDSEVCTAFHATYKNRPGYPYSVAAALLLLSLLLADSVIDSFASKVRRRCLRRSAVVAVSKAVLLALALILELEVLAPPRACASV